MANLLPRFEAVISGVLAAGAYCRRHRASTKTPTTGLKTTLPAFLNTSKTFQSLSSHDIASSMLTLLTPAVCNTLFLVNNAEQIRPRLGGCIRGIVNKHCIVRLDESIHGDELAMNTASTLGNVDKGRSWEAQASGYGAATS